VDRVARLASLSVALFADALEGRGILPPFITPQVPVEVVAGPAYTVALPGGDNLGIHVAIAEAPPGSVVVAAFEEPVEYGIWGSIASTAAARAGLAAFVTNAFVRDRRGLAEIGFPVFARGVYVRQARKADPGRHQVPVRLGEQTVSPGDLVCGDADGVVAIPEAELEGAVERAERIAEKEAVVVRRLALGETTIDLLCLTR
jgi:4-hydroxy-4-methyl-2-oxoglutarate aldolase